MKAELTIMKIKCTQEMLGKDIFITCTEKSSQTQKSVPYANKMACQIKYGGKHNIERHDLFWACVALVCENTGLSSKQVEETCKIDCRWLEGYTHYKDKNGKERVNVMTKSISFSDMTLEEADEFYSKAFDVLAGYLQIETEKMIEEAKLRMKNPKYCIICGKRAVHKHHKFSQTKWAIDKYRKDLINADFNIVMLCPDCHSSHANVPKNLIWTEQKFINEAIKNGYKI